MFNPHQIHNLIAEAELADEQADAREAARIVRVRPVSGPRQCATGLRKVAR